MRKQRPTLRATMGEAFYLHRGDLIDSGWSPDVIRTAVAREGLERAGRQWILRPDVEADLRLAAGTGSIVTCVSAAKKLELWVSVPPEMPHLAIPRGARRAPVGAHAHWSTPVLARPPRTLVDEVVNTLGNVAECLAHEEALMVWDSALRKALLTPEDMAAVPWMHAKARRLSTEATARSHSGIETKFANGMRRRGVEVRQQVKIAGHHVDALVGKRVVVQIDGYAHHSDARQRRSDIAHDRALQRLGFVPFRFDYFEVMHEWERVETTVLRALAREGRT